MNVFMGAGCNGQWYEPTWCNFFPQTLTGLARAWFNSLPVGSLASFEDLHAKFLAHFSQQRRHERDSMNVINIWRRDDESLKAFVVRYNKECLEIGDVADQMAPNHFIKAVRDKQMVMTISGKECLPKKWEDVMAAVKTYAQTQRSLEPYMAKAQPQAETSHQGSKRNNKSNRYVGNRDNISKPYFPRTNLFDPRNHNAQRDNRASKKDSRDRNWTEITVSPSEVLITDAQLLRPAQPMKFKKNQDLTLYCEYHKDSGHTTNNCISLWLEIERALKEGKLQHLLPGGQKPTKRITPHGEGTSSRKRTMYVASTHMINGGKGRPHKAARRPDNDWKDEQVVFPKIRGGPRDRRAVVITGQLAHYCTERLFIDPGSTSDIIYEQCFSSSIRRTRIGCKQWITCWPGSQGKLSFP
ncbi:putative retrotransposon gag domain-containing protein [Helianthus annuus]|nr:putative retrotransposon gag domain-containing protein [Helianthus annuus]